MGRVRFDVNYAMGDCVGRSGDATRGAATTRGDASRGEDTPLGDDIRCDARQSVAGGENRQPGRRDLSHVSRLFGERKVEVGPAWDRLGVRGGDA